MTKRPEYEITACQYFVEMQMSIAEISRRLNISEKTLHGWKKNGNWEEKRARFLKSQYSTNQTLYELLHAVSKKALDDFKAEGIMPDQKTLYFIMSMSDKLEKLKSFERKTALEKVEEIKQVDNISLNNEPKEEMQEMMKRFFAAINGG